MSVQLILYPQNYEGQYSSISTPFFTEHVSDYSFNIGTLGSGFSGTANSQNDMYSNLSPLNIWQQFNATGGVYTTANAATVSSGKITLDSASSGYSFTGIYQLISNLQIGSTYVLKVQRLAGTTGFVTIGHNTSFTNNNVQYHPITFTTLPNTVGTHTFTFTATHTEQVFSINYINNDNSNLEIGEVSIQENVSSAPTVDVFRDGQVICDLYEESNIPLSLSVDDFKNVAEKKQSFSKPFKLPATKRNNKIFTSLFDVTKSVKDDIFSFNPYKKTKAILKEDGYTIFDGYLTLIDVVDKEKEISYNVNLYGETITLKDKLKDKKLKNFNNGFEELTHLYNKTNIKNTFTSTGVTYTSSATSGFRAADTVKYPLCDWNGNITLDTNENPVLNLLEDGYRPWLNCKYLVDRIITEAGFTYNSDFLESTDFTKLYMDFNWGSGNEIIEGNGSQPCSSSSSSAGLAATATSSSYQPFQLDQSYPLDINFSDEIGYDNTNHKFVCPADNIGYKIEYWINTRIYNSTTYSGRWKHTSDATGAITYYDQWSASQSANVTIQGSGTVYIQCNTDDEIVFEHKTTGSGDARQSNFTGFIFGVKYVVTIGQTIATSNNLLQSMRGEIKQWDLLKGFTSMFDLVILKDKNNPSNLIIEPYKSVFLDTTPLSHSDHLSQYIEHKTLDWTSKVDISEIKLKPLKLKKKVSFKYQVDKDDHAKNIYENTTTNKYGDYEIDASTFTLLEGETKIEAKPFGSTYIKPLFDTTSEIICPAIFKGNEDGTFEGYENNPRICYDNGEVTMVSHTIYLPVQNGVTSENSTKYLQFSHLSEIPTTASTKDYNFGAAQFILGIGNTPIDNLYNTYWSPYYDELYNPDTRQVNIKIYLTPADIANFEFYFTIRIKNKLYRVNKIEYKPYELSSVELILIA